MTHSQSLYWTYLSDSIKVKRCYTNSLPLKFDRVNGISLSIALKQDWHKSTKPAMAMLRSSNRPMVFNETHFKQAYVYDESMI